MLIYYLKQMNMRKEFKPIYSRDSKGNIVVWTAKVVNTGAQVDICKSYGLLDGKRAITWERNVQGKNIGKANETTPFEQAISKVESAIKRKKDKGYKSMEDLGISTIDELDNTLPQYRTDAQGRIKPMKAQQYYRSKKDWTAPDGTVYDDRKYYYMQNPHVKKEPKSIISKFPVMAQPKINGVRATISLFNGEPKILSKEGKEYEIPHILDYLRQKSDVFVWNGEDVVLDGELYIHGEPLQEIASAVKKISLTTQRVVYVVFDLAIANMIQLERWQTLKSIHTQHFSDLSSPIELIRSIKVPNDKLAQELTDKFIGQGYEGAIFRDFNAQYKFGGRPMTMTKLKRTISEEFKITNVLPQDKDPTKGNFICINEKGKTFAVNPKGTDDYKRNVLKFKNDMIGHDLTLVFYEWTADRLPFHIIDMHIRDYE